MLRFLNSRRQPPDQAPPADPALALFTEYAELIYALCLRYLGTPERAEDAGMEVYAVLRQKLPKHEVHNPRSWLQTLVRNHCLMQLRRERREPPVVSTDTLVQTGPPLHLLTEPDDGPPDTRALHGCLQQLRDEQRSCVRLFYLTEGATYQSVADQLDLTIGRVRSHLQNGRRNLKICLEKRAAAADSE